MVLTVTTGQGHNSTAKALKEEFVNHGYECEIVDVYYHASKILGNMMSKGYLLAVSTFSKFYSMGYKKQEKRKPNKNDTAVKISKMLSKKLSLYIKDYNPDVVVCSHVFGALTLKESLKRIDIKPKTIGVVTDFTVHPYWEDTNYLDYLVLPTVEMTELAKQKGFREEQILPFGIPIAPKFSIINDKKEARKSLGLDPEKKTVLLMNGSMCFKGLSHNIKAIDNLSEDFNVIAVCGSSKKELKYLNKHEFKHDVLKLGYVNNIDTLMDASDCIITKPGGLSSSEAFSKELPMIISNYIPGHEQRNAEFLVSEEAAAEVTEETPTEMLLAKFFDDEEFSNKLKEGSKRIGKKNPSHKIVEFVTSIL